MLWLENIIREGKFFSANEKGEDVGHYNGPNLEEIRNSSTTYFRIFIAAFTKDDGEGENGFIGITIMKPKDNSDLPFFYYLVNPWALLLELWERCLLLLNAITGRKVNMDEFWLIDVYDQLGFSWNSKWHQYDDCTGRYRMYPSGKILPLHGPELSTQDELDNWHEETSKFSRHDPETRKRRKAIRLEKEKRCAEKKSFFKN